MAGRKEIGVIPYVERNTFYQFMIITTRKNNSKWIFPKGQPEDGKKDREVAVNEAFEEAGLIGTIQGKPIKIKCELNGDTVQYKLYPFKISKVCRRWPEKNLRKRLLAKGEKAAKLLTRKPYMEALNVFMSDKNY